MTAYLTVFNLFVWSHGIMLMSGKSESVKKNGKKPDKPLQCSYHSGSIPVFNKH